MECKALMGGRPRIKAFASGLLLSWWASGCAYLTIDSRPPLPEEVGVEQSFALEGGVGATDFVGVATRNTFRARFLIADERRLYSARTELHEFPRIGVALSGGGSRAAAFSLGVLHTLNESEFLRMRNLGLQDIDILSSVSGGAYANYYLQSNGIRYPERRVSELLSVQGVSGRPASRGILPWWWFAYSVAQPLICLPLNIVFSPFPSEDGDLSCGNINYGTALWSSYGADYGNLFGRLRLSDVADKLPSDIPDRRPFPIFAASVLVGKDRNCNKSDPKEFRSLHTSVVEITPLRMGSEWLGFRKVARLPFLHAPGKPEVDIEMRNAVAVSGAALDGRQSGYCKLVRGFGYSLGKESDRWPVSRPVVSFEGREARLENLMDTYSVAFIDGGETENLGIFPLVKRLTRKILVVDSGFDPEHRFPSYWCLKKKLAHQGITIDLPKLELDSAVDLSLPASSQCDLVRGAESDPGNFRARRAGGLVYWGKVKELPHFVTNGPLQEFRTSLSIAYLKLGLPAHEILSFKRAITERYLVSDGVLAKELIGWLDKAEAKTSCRRKVVIGSLTCPFPMVETTNQNLGRTQYLAYYFLGRFAAEKMLENDEAGEFFN